MSGAQLAHPDLSGTKGNLTMKPTLRSLLFAAVASVAFVAAVASVAVLATLSMPAFAATPSADPLAQRVEIIAPSPTLAAARVVLSTRYLDATYEMSTGHRMSVATMGDVVIMRLGRRAAQTLRHDGQGSFVSANGQLALEFELDALGDPQAVRLSLPASWL